MEYIPQKNRYSAMPYRQCGKSGLKLPEISLGLWHNFGHKDSYRNAKELIFEAFDSGITHFDLANNYGPPPGSAEENFGKILTEHMSAYRDEMIISTKAGYPMWEGPYGDGGGRKYLLSSLDQSLKRMKLDYVDIFYSHRFDTNTPLEETLEALHYSVQVGKALYIGISNYPAKETQEAVNYFSERKTPFIIHQVKYSMFVRDIEDELLDVLAMNKKGCIVFSPLAQGLLSDRYLKGIPKDSRAGGQSVFLAKEQINEKLVSVLKQLKVIAQKRNQSIAQMAIAWILRHATVTSVLIGASRVSQLNNNIKAIENTFFTKEEIEEIDEIVEQIDFPVN